MQKHRESNWLSHLRILLFAVLATSLVLTAGPVDGQTQANDDSTSPGEFPEDSLAAVSDVPSPRPAHQKPGSAEIHAGHSDHFVNVKLAEGSNVRVRAGKFAGRSANDLNVILESLSAGTPAPLFTRSEQDLAEDKERNGRRSGKAQPDKNLWFRIAVGDADPAALIDALNELSLVEIALAQPVPAPLPVSPDFSTSQSYPQPAPVGIGASLIDSVPGSSGSNVRIIDIEYVFNGAHEELVGAAIELTPNGTPCNPFEEFEQNHGTAVLGQLVGADNGFGITGLVPDAEVGFVNAASRAGLACAWRVAEAIDVAQSILSPGDVLLIEQQFEAPPGGSCSGVFDFVAPEYYRPIYDAIFSATSAGIIVVETAGNGGCNFDDPFFGSSFPQGLPDSGAIIVGAGYASAGTNPHLGRKSDSSYGSRVNLQGQGELVVTAGYGDLFETTVNDRYTQQFAGTSSAAPIVAGAAAMLSSIAQEGGSLLSSEQIRSRLIETGTPQNRSVGTQPGHIGPQPNIAAAVADLCSTNDLFACSAILPPFGVDAVVTNSGFDADFLEPVPSCSASPGENSAWWTWTPTLDTIATVTATGFDTVLSIWTGSSVDALAEIGCNDNNLGPGSLVEFSASAGTTYHFRVSGFANATGTIELSVRHDATDASPPVVTFPQPNVFIDESSPQTVSGTISDVGSGVGFMQLVAIDIGFAGAPGVDPGLLRFWDGSGWVFGPAAAPPFLPVTVVDGQWSFEWDPVPGGSGSYSLGLRAFDNVGNKWPADKNWQALVIISDTSRPTLTLDAPAVIGSTITWSGQASDDVAVRKMRMIVRHVDSNTYWNGVDWVDKDQALADLADPNRPNITLTPDQTNSMATATDWSLTLNTDRTGQFVAAHWAQNGAYSWSPIQYTSTVKQSQPAQQAGNYQ